METHSSILAWRIPWTEEPGDYSQQGCKELDWATERLRTAPKACLERIKKSLFFSVHLNVTLFCVCVFVFAALYSVYVHAHTHIHTFMDAHAFFMLCIHEMSFEFEIGNK